MINKNNEQNKAKQQLEFVKKLAEINNQNVINNLLREVKKARQQIDPVIKQVKDKIVEIKERKKEDEIVRQAEVKAAQQAEIVKKEKEAPKEEVEVMTVKPKQPEKIEVVEVAKVDNPTPVKEQSPIQHQDYKKVDDEAKPFNQAPRQPFQPGQRPPYQQGQQRSSYQQNQRPEFQSDRRPYQQGSPRPPYQPGQRPPYQPGQRPPYQQGQRPPYQPGQRPPYQQGQGQRPPYQPGGAPRPAFNRDGSPRPPRPFGERPSFAKKPELTSAASVFVNKERNYGNKKKTAEKSTDDKKYNKRQLIRRGIIEEQSIEERMVSRKLKLKKPKNDNVIVYAPVTKAIITTPNLTVRILSEKIGKPVTDIIKQFMLLGTMTTVNSVIDFSAAELVSSELGIELELKIDKSYEEKLIDNIKRDTEDSKQIKRPAIVTVMGHVDHGKTSLLDYLRKTNVTSGEAGGITQHIGSYSITVKNEKITFIDTPGHQAFTAMRARGAKITDIAILVVAADDGIMPQTVEAINHIKAAKVPMIVAINKIDKQGANIDRIKQQLAENEVLPEEWGGDAILVPVSALTGEGIDKLLDMILLVAEVNNLKANPEKDAIGVVVEAKLDKGKGPVANVIIQDGTLHTGDTIVTGFAFGRVRAMIDDTGKSINVAGPSTPVSILGFDSVPNAGDTFQVVDEKLSKNVIEERKVKMAQEMQEKGLGRSIDDFLKTPAGEDKKVLNLIIKGDVQGTVEALKQSLKVIENEEVKVDIVHAGVGNITEGDVQLANVSNALIFGFNVKMDAKTTNSADKLGVKVTHYSIIYEAIEDVEKLIKGMKEPKFEEVVVGHAEVRVIFKISNVGAIAGCRILDGKIMRNASAKVLRKKEVIFEGKISSLKNQKDDVKELAAGFECGIKIDGFNDYIENDIIECITKQKIED